VLYSYILLTSIVSALLCRLLDSSPLLGPIVPFLAILPVISIFLIIGIFLVLVILVIVVTRISAL